MNHICIYVCFVYLQDSSQFFDKCWVKFDHFANEQMIWTQRLRYLVWWDWWIICMRMKIQKKKITKKKKNKTKRNNNSRCSNRPVRNLWCIIVVVKLAAVMYAPANYSILIWNCVMTSVYLCRLYTVGALTYESATFVRVWEIIMKLTLAHHFLLWNIFVAIFWEGE